MKRKVVDALLLMLGALVFSSFQSAAHAEVLRFDQVVEQSVQNAYDLKTASIDVNLAKTGVKAKKLDYLPSMSGRMYTEYLGDLVGGEQPVVAVGQTILPSSTKYQNSYSLVASYTLFDFGARGKQVAMAQKDVLTQQSVYSQNLLNLKLKLIDLYLDALLTNRSLKGQKVILSLYQTLFQIAERLHEAGKISKVEVADEAIRLAQTVNEIDSLKQQLQDSLEDLSFYTKAQYDLEDTELVDFEDERLSNTEGLVIENLPEFQLYQSAIDKKKLQLQALKRQNLPAFSSYFSYNFYGSDHNSLLTTFDNTRARSAVFGISTIIPFTDIFKNNVEMDKVRLEIQRLEMEQEQKIAERIHTFKKEQSARSSYNNELVHRNESLVQSQERLAMIERLSEQAMVDQSELLRQKIRVIEEGLELEKIRLQKLASRTRMDVLSKGGSS